MSFSNNIPALQNQLPLSIELPKDLENLRTELNDIYQSIASATNNKVGGLYVPQEKINSEQYFVSTDPQSFKIVYRMVVDFGTLPNTATKSVAHNIPNWDSNFRLTSSWGAATDPTGLQALPIPNADITLRIDATNVNVTTISNLTAYTSTTIVIEYTKAG